MDQCSQQNTLVSDIECIYSEWKPLCDAVIAQVDQFSCMVPNMYNIAWRHQV